jgi:hypothetical protein
VQCLALSGTCLAPFEKAAAASSRPQGDATA